MRSFGRILTMFSMKVSVSCGINAVFQPFSTFMLHHETCLEWYWSNNGYLHTTSDPKTPVLHNEWMNPSLKFLHLVVFHSVISYIKVRLVLPWPNVYSKSNECSEIILIWIEECIKWTKLKCLNSYTPSSQCLVKTPWAASTATSLFR